VAVVVESRTGFIVITYVRETEAKNIKVGVLNYGP
jgi:hypothetical protein